MGEHLIIDRQIDKDFPLAPEDLQRSTFMIQGKVDRIGGQQAPHCLLILRPYTLLEGMEYLR
jgi:hypothetical protein